MATSLALLAGASAASAQAPKWESNGPPKTQWAPFPAPAAPKTTPVTTAPKPTPAPATTPVVVQPPALTPEPAATIGTRVVLFQKPAEVAPEQKVEPKVDPKVDPKDPKPVDAKTLTGDPAKDRDVVFHMNADDKKHETLLAPEMKHKAANEATANPAIARAASSPPKQALLEPGFVVHRRLFFEDKNSERYGWNFGMAQPFISAAYFCKDVALLPAHAASNLRERYSTNAGKFLPGSPVPYYLYPPEITLTGGALGAGAIVGMIFLFP